jgi:hypothetical protein
MFYCGRKLDSQKLVSEIMHNNFELLIYIYIYIYAFTKQGS